MSVPEIGTARSLQRRTSALHLAGLAPALLLLAVFFLYPLSALLFTAFFTPRFSLVNLARIFRTDTYVLVLLFTIKVSLYTTAVCTVLGYLAAYVLANVGVRAARLLTVAVILPYFTSMLVRTYAWMLLLGTTGAINRVLLDLSIISRPLHLMYNQAAIVLGMSYVLLPYMILTVYTTLSGINPQIPRAAHALGASRLQTFRRVTLPLSLPGVAAGALLVFLLALGFFIVPSLMGGPSNRMIGVLIENEVEITLNWPFASALSIVLLATTLALFALYCRAVHLGRLFGEQS
jgi:putative spermidine/putrescine transport system permease protein